MRGYDYTKTGSLNPIAIASENIYNSLLQPSALEAVENNAILMAMYLQREQRRALFQKQVISRTIPEAVHSIPRQRFLENT